MRRSDIAWIEYYKRRTPWKATDRCHVSSPGACNGRTPLDMILHCIPTVFSIRSKRHFSFAEAVDRDVICRARDMPCTREVDKRLACRYSHHISCTVEKSSAPYNSRHSRAHLGLPLSPKNVYLQAITYVGNRLSLTRC